MFSEMDVAISLYRLLLMIFGDQEFVFIYCIGH